MNYNNNFLATYLNRSFKAIIATFAILLFVALPFANASHGAGADLTYQCIGNNTYRFHLSFYRDCSGITPTFPQLSVNGCGTAATIGMSQIGQPTELSPVCNLGATTCTGGTLPGIQRYEFMGTYTFPSQCANWNVSFSQCCRDTISNITGNYDYDLYVDCMVNNLNVLCNNSPDFTQYPVSYVCAGQPFTYYQGSYDSEGDSLVYDLVNPLAGPYPGTNITTYISGLSPTQFLSTVSGTGGIVLNPSTGRLTFTANGPQTSVFSMRVREYRNGLLIGTVRRDMQIIVTNCPVNIVPQIGMVSNLSGAQFTAADNTFRVCPNQQMSFNITVTDANATQTVTIYSNATTNFPTSTVSITNGTGNARNYNFMWTSPATNSSQTLSLFARDNNCPSNSSITQNYTIIVEPLSNVSITGATAFCAGANTTLTASGGTSYVWSNGINTVANAITAAGTYTVTVTNTAGCTATTSQAVITNALPTANIAGATAFCSGANTTLTASGGTSYVWSNSVNTAANSIAAAGTYTVTVTNAAGCTATTNRIVTTNALPTANIAGATAFCAGANTTLTASGGTSYVWSNGINTVANAITAAGTYTVTVTNAAGCTATTSQTVTENALPTASIAGATAFCTGANTTLTASGGISYAWSNSVNTAANTIAAAGTYTVTVTNAAGCTTTTNRTVTTNALPTASIAGATAFCAGTNTTLTASGATGYAWSNSINTAANAITAAGTYTVTVTNAVGCTATASQTVTTNALPTANITGATAFCAGANTTLTASGGTSYVWSNGINTVANAITAAGTYTVTVTNAAGCTATASKTVTINALPTASITGATAFCLDANTTLTASGGTSYAWSNGINTVANAITAAGTYTVTVTNTVGCTATTSQAVITNALPTANIAGATAFCTGANTTLTASGGTGYAWSNSINTAANTIAAAGTYTVTVTNTTGCTATASQTVTTNALPTANITGATAFCAGANTTLTASGGTSYAWSNSINTAANAITAAGTYTVTVTNAVGCTATASQTVTENALPTANITGATAFCSGANTTLTASGGTSYAWSNSINTAANSIAAVGTYTVTVTNAAGCTATTSQTVTENALPTANITGATAFCAGANTTLTASGGIGYVWSNSVNTATNTIATAGTYTVTVTNAQGCTAILSSSIIVNTLPNVVLTSSNDLTCNNVSSILNSSGGVLYDFGSGFSTVNMQPVMTLGVYTVTVEDVNGCTASQSVIVNQDTNAPIATLVNSNNLDCTNTNATLSAGGGSLYDFGTGFISINAQTITNGGVYTVTVQAVNGCTSTQSVSIAQDTTIPVVTISGDAEICAGQTSILIATGGDSYIWNTAEITDSITVSNTGTYTVTTTTTANGCTNTQTVSMIVNILPTASISLLGNVLTANQADTYQWYLNGILISGATNQTYTATQSGDYTVQISINNCMAMSSILSYVYVSILDISNESMKWEIYPNPTDKDEITLSYSAVQNGKISVYIYNAIGQIVHQTEINATVGINTETLNLPTLPAGVYLLKTADESNRVLIRKIIKN
jgi:Secretion system C-terminal sorting domain